MSHDQEDKIKVLQRRNKNYRVATIGLVVILATFGVAFYIGEKNERDNIVNNDYPLIDPAREIIPQKYFITNIQPLRDYLISVGKREGDNISIYYEQLNTGANISINKEVRFNLASLVKLPTAMIAMKKVEDDVWKGDTSFKVEPADVDSGSGELYKNTGKTSYTFDELITPLIVDSDNTAHNIFTRNFTQADYDSIFNEVGLEDLFNEKFEGSAKEYSRLLRALYTSSYLHRPSSEKILELMGDATFKGFLSGGIPSDIKFAHKYGENTDLHIFADSGIVYVPHKPYMITVIYHGKGGTAETEKYAENLMKEISTKAYDIGK